MRVQMLGLCRFSYVGLRGYQQDHATFDERRAFLYDPGRLARRWRWFATLALPGWLAQTDPDFTLVIMTGPDLPEPYMSRLRDLAEATPQLRLELVPPMELHLDACRAAIAPHVDPRADVVGHFRHDDDDAVALDYVASARRDFAQVQGLWQAEGKLSLDHSRGLMLRAGAGGAEFVPRIAHNMGVALTIFLRPDQPQTALHFNHMKLPLWMPVVAVTRPLMFIRSIHADSDSGDMGPGIPWRIEEAELDRQLSRRFGLTRADLESLARAGS
ncbi:glycosyltransferase [Paracoccus benzoatiresistens]|uniref:Glycosyltransferase n=1 Tax=Paracoccus benzoatiresistens TaxID=2997341 RepID=A0ABT4J2V0_9RHOB|nr:glycosyltransferase [Paracoccus sp. EF6]MCZ0961444.1 glycosyltransferase [Paracoccus sp. EF6]